MITSPERILVAVSAVLLAPVAEELEQLWQTEPRRTIPGGATMARKLLTGLDALPTA